MSECKGCGKCCQNILLLTDQEIQRIKKYVKKNNIKLINRNTIFSTSDVCPFLNKDNKCNIYPVRAEICKNFYCAEYMNTEPNLNYTNIKAIDMLLTFGEGKEFYPNPPDLTEINNNIKQKAEILRRGGYKYEGK